MRDAAVPALEEHREMRAELFGDVVGVEDRRLGRQLQAGRAHHADVHPGDRQDRCAAERCCRHRMRGAFRDMAGQERLQMRLDADRADAGSAAAMRDAEGLVQVHVADVGADVARPRQADHGVEVGAVEIDLAAMLMHQRAHVAHAFLEDAVRRRIGDHQRGEVGRMLGRLRLEVVHVDVAGFLAGDDHDAHAGHAGAGRIGAMRGGGDQADVAVASPRDAWKRRIASSPAYSPWLPALGCSETPSKPVISASQRSSSSIMAR